MKPDDTAMYTFTTGPVMPYEFSPDDKIKNILYAIQEISEILDGAHIQQIYIEELHVLFNKLNETIDAMKLGE